MSGDVSNGFYRHTLPYENRNDNWRIADRMARLSRPRASCTPRPPRTARRYRD